MNVREENKPARRENKMTTARDVIRIVIEDIDSEIKMLESLHEYALGKRFDSNAGKRSAMAAGIDYLQASEKFNFSIGFHEGMAGECEDRINVLKRKRCYYESLDMLYREEAEEEAEANE